MSLGLASTGSHADDAALVRHLDGESSPDEQVRISAHLGHCAACAQRRRELAERARRFADLLVHTDPAPRSFALHAERDGSRKSPARVRWWPAVAAAGLALVAVTLFADPVRAWILERWADVRRLMNGEAHQATPVTPLRTPTSDTVGVVSFTPTSDVLTVRLTSRQAGGTLRLETTTGMTVSTIVSDAANGEELIVLPDELRIVNSAASRASYRVIIPGRLRRLVLAIGEDPPLAFTPPGSRSLDLGLRARP